MLSLWDALRRALEEDAGPRASGPKRRAPRTAPRDIATTSAIRQVGNVTRSGASGVSRGVGEAIASTPNVGAVRRVTRAEAAARMRREIAADRREVRRSADPIIARGDALAARATQGPRDDLSRRVRAAYVAQPGENLLGGDLERLARSADPAITFTEKITRPFTTPATVAASLIDADPTNAIKQLVSASYWGRYRFPSEALNDRGWLPDGAAGMLLGLGADVAPSFALPGVKPAATARGRAAGRRASREQPLPRSGNPRVPFEDQAARTGAPPLPLARTRDYERELAMRRQRRAARLNTRRGPDIITNPRAATAPTRPVTGGGATVGTRPRPQGPRRRGAEDLPYFPSPQMERAAGRVQRRRADLDVLTAPQPSPRRVAMAGRRLGRAEGALSAAERATVGRIRRRAAGVASAQGRPPKLLPPPVVPTKRTKTDVFVDSGSSSARDIGGWRKGIQVGADKIVVNLGRPGAPPRWVVARRDVDSTDFYGGRPSDPRQPRVGEARIIYNAERGGPQGILSSHRTRAEALAAAGSAALSPRASSVPGGSPASLRPLTVSELRRSSVTPVEGGRSLPQLRTRVNRETGAVERLTIKPPTPKQIAKAGQRLEKAQAKLRRLESEMLDRKAPKPKADPRAGWKKERSARSGTRPDISQRQVATNREVFTGSRVREWIDANMEVEAAYRAAADAAPIGVNVTLPFNWNGKGLTIPFATAEASQKFRALLRSSKVGEAVVAYRQWFVSRYGPNEVVRHGALAADDVTRLNNGVAQRFVIAEKKRHKISEKEDILAAQWLEGTATGVVPVRVQNYATKLAQYTERNLDEFIQAGGKVKRFGQKLEGGLDRQYVLHLLPRREQDAFAVSALARRQMLYGKRPSFTKKREVLTIEDLKRAGFNPEERLGHLTFARASAHNRAMAEMELERSSVRRFGRPAKEAPDDWESVPSQFVDHDMVVPKDVAQTLRNVIAARLAVPRNKASEALQRGNAAWKEWVLLTAGHDIRNQFGDSSLQFQRTLNPLAPILGLSYGVKTLTGRGRVGGKSNLTSAQAKRLGETAGMRDTGLLGGDVLSDVVSTEAQGLGSVKRAGVRRPIQAMHRGVRTARTYREGANKMGIFTRELRRGEGPVWAGRTAKEWIYDYADVGSAVNFARRFPVGAPFATWIAKNLPAQMKMAVQTPAQLSAILTMVESLRRQVGQEVGFREALPRFFTAGWLRRRVPVPVPGYGMTNFDMPVNTLNMLPSGTPGSAGGGFRDIVDGPGGFTDVLKEWGAQLSPLAQLPIAVAGIDPFTGEPFRDQRAASRVEQFLQKFPVTAFFLGQGGKVLGRDSGGEQVAVPSANDDLFAWAFRQMFPFVGTAGRMTGSENRTWLDSARGPLLGHNRAPFADPVQIESRLRGMAWDYREALGDFNRRMKAEAPGWKKGDPIPKSLNRQYVEIARLLAQAEVMTEVLRRRSRATRRG